VKGQHFVTVLRGLYDE